MSTPRVLASPVSGGIGCRFNPREERLYYVEWAGQVSSVDLAGDVRVHGTGYSQLEDIAIAADGRTAYLSQRDGTIFIVDLDNADIGNAKVLTSGLDEPQQLALREDDGVVWVVEFGPSGRLLAVDLGSGDQRVLLGGLERAVGLVATSDGRRAIVSEQAASGGRVRDLEVDGSASAVLAGGLTSPFFLTWLADDDGDLLVCERDPANRVTIIRADGSRWSPVPAGAARPSCTARFKDMLFVTADQEVDVYDLPAGPTQVGFDVPSDALFIGEWRRVTVDAGASPVPFDDLEFVVVEGIEGGDVSPSRDVTFDPSRPEIMLLAGHHGGTYRLRALDPATATVLGEAKFEVTELWDDDRSGPSHWFTGIVPGYSANPTWGGGPSGVPQNFNTVPALGTRRVAILFVDTSDQRYTTTAATFDGFKQRWQDNAFDGVTGADGVTRSTRLFYEEVSYTGLTIQGQVFPDPVHLTGGWAAYFQMDVNNLWQAKGEFINQCIAAAPSAWNLTGFDMVVCVTQAVTGATAKVAWPYGGYGVDVNTTNGRVTGRGISMPNEWGDGSASDQGGGRTIFETLSHEMGHTLNLPDEYQPAVAGRNLGGWDPMDSEGPLPHFTVAHRMMLGWTQASWIRRFDFQVLGTNVDEIVTLTPIENGAPAAGKFAAVEVRIGNGRNYYFEYRRTAAGQIGDAQLPANPRVVGTDVSEPPDPVVMTRPDILLLPKHSTDDGAVLTTGQHYGERDSTTPTHPADFSFELQTAGAEAGTRVKYGIFGRPDPSIRPWPRDAQHQWQSPDITVSNPRSVADPANWANVPWSGHPNTVVARVSNDGNISAPGVTVNFYVKDYTVGGAPESFIGTDTHDLPAGPGVTVDFTTSWNPPAPATPATPQHFCIIARIDSYDTPTPTPIHELTDVNNTAQSNYDRFISATASPASRELTSLTIGNPYDKGTFFFIRAGQTNPIYRTYLEHTWLWLDAHEVRRVEVMLEYAEDAPLTDKNLDKMRREFMKRPNIVDFTGRILDPTDPRLHGPRLLQGATVHVHTGRRTRFDKWDAKGDHGSGRVVDSEGQPVVSGAVVVWADGDKRRRTYHHATLHRGSFKVMLPGRWKSATAYYVPGPGFGDCTSETVHGG